MKLIYINSFMDLARPWTCVNSLDTSPTPLIDNGLNTSILKCTFSTLLFHKF